MEDPSLLERVDQSIRRSVVWRSLFRQPYPRDERSRAYAVMNNVFLHPEPGHVRAADPQHPSLGRPPDRLLRVPAHDAGLLPRRLQAAARVQLGGREVGQNTLLRFYVVHVIVLPLVAAIFLAVHFWRIRKDGGISGPL